MTYGPECPFCEQAWQPPHDFVAGQWPVANSGRFTALPQFAHTLHYKKGPTAYVEYRQRGMKEVHRVWCGQTAILDCRVQYEARAQYSSQTGTALDVCLSNTGPATTKNFDVECRIDELPTHRSPGIVQLQWTLTTNFGDANVPVLNIPAEGIIYGDLHVQCSGLIGAGTATFDPIAILQEGTGFSFPAVAPVTAVAQRRAVQWKPSFEVTASANLYNLVPSAMGGELDRFRLDCDGAGASGSVAMLVDLKMRIREAR